MNIKTKICSIPPPVLAISDESLASESISSINVPKSSFCPLIDLDDSIFNTNQVPARTDFALSEEFPSRGSTEKSITNSTSKHPEGDMNLGSSQLGNHSSVLSTDINSKKRQRIVPQDEVLGESTIDFKSGRNAINTYNPASPVMSPLSKSKLNANAKEYVYKVPIPQSSLQSATIIPGAIPEIITRVSDNASAIAMDKGENRIKKKPKWSAEMRRERDAKELEKLAYEKRLTGSCTAPDIINSESQVSLVETRTQPDSDYTDPLAGQLKFSEAPAIPTMQGGLAYVIICLLKQNPDRSISLTQLEIFLTSVYGNLSEIYMREIGKKTICLYVRQMNVLHLFLVDNLHKKKIPNKKLSCRIDEASCLRYNSTAYSMAEVFLLIFEKKNYYLSHTPSANENADRATIVSVDKFSFGRFEIFGKSFPDKIDLGFKDTKEAHRLYLHTVIMDILFRVHPRFMPKLEVSSELQRICVIEKEIALNAVNNCFSFGVHTSADGLQMVLKSDVANILLSQGNIITAMLRIINNESFGFIFDLIRDRPTLAYVESKRRENLLLAAVTKNSSLNTPVNFETNPLENNKEVMPQYTPPPLPPGPRPPPIPPYSARENAVSSSLQLKTITDAPFRPPPPPTPVRTIPQANAIETPPAPVRTIPQANAVETPLAPVRTIPQANAVETPPAFDSQQPDTITPVLLNSKVNLPLPYADSVEQFLAFPNYYQPQLLFLTQFYANVTTYTSFQPIFFIKQFFF